MKVGWLADTPEAPGGAELTQHEFRSAAPEGVEIVDCPPDKVDTDCDRYVVHNCVQYHIEDFRAIEGKPVIKYWHDIGPWISPEVRWWFTDHALNVCCSPAQAEHMTLDALCVPPPVDLERFEQAAGRVNGNRKGNVSVGSWRNHGKAPHKAAEWALERGGVEFYGGGPLAPPGASEVPYEQMPDLLARYERFVFLPTVIEPFGRLVAEAWAAGCEIVTNDLVGARYWLETNPEAISTAAEDFWGIVLA